LNTGENMLFRSEDFQPPFHTATWAQLASLRDTELDQLTERIQECCVPGWSPSGGLDELLAPRVKPWWERTAQAEVPPPRPEPVPMPPPRPQPVGPARPQGQPTQNWWAAAPVPQPRKPARRIVLAALALGLIVALVSEGITAATGGEGGGGAAFGVILAMIVLIIGFARRRLRKPR
jgi:eukaryotic-like serine/threonine-protein kinase